MASYTVHQAKTQLSKLIAAAEAGEEVVILRGKTPVARLQPIGQGPKRVFGAYRGQAGTTDAFFESLPESVLAAFEEGAVEPPVPKAVRRRPSRKTHP